MKTVVKKKITIGLATFLLLTQPVFGTTLFGGSDCGQWLSSKTEARKAWALGFMSGLSAASYLNKNTNGDWLDKVNSAEQIFIFIDNYCQKNPLRKVDTAATHLYWELISQ